MTDTNHLLTALTNDENVSLLNMTTKKIETIKENVLDELGIDDDTYDDYLDNKLKDYMYVDEIPDVKFGSYIRWISLKDPENLKLTAGGIICDININENGVCILCKSIRNRMFQIRMDECLIFRKLTGQEKVLLSVMNHLNDE